MIYLVFLPVFFIVMLSYFRIADHYNIIDKPNERSSHSELTIRGGGIIFLIAGLFALVLEPTYWMPILGLFIIGTISFIDDRVTLSGKIRVLFHLIAVTLMFVSLNVFTTLPWWVCTGLYVVIIGAINAYNFMDGINGITGAYSLVVLLALQYVNYEVRAFIKPDLIWLPVMACLVFLFFNFRKRAKCFAGDVGSVSIAFWIIYLLAKLILESGNYSYVLFLSIYGVDAVMTIIHRLKLRQNIFDAHRLHFYQILANEQQWPHLLVSSVYAGLQLGIIVMVVFLPFDFTYLFLSIVGLLVMLYCFIKPRIMLKKNI